MLKVVEIFESLQGEVPSGRYALFIRCYGCNRKCSFCDTIYSWDNTSYFEIDVDNLHLNGVDYIVITGGEPLLQKDTLTKFVKKLKEKYPGIEVAIETNGDCSDFDFNLFDLIVVSPKTFDTLYKWLKLAHQYKNIVIKVVDKPDNEKLYENLKARLDKGLIETSVLRRLYIMPFGKTAHEVIKNTHLVIQRLKKYNLKQIKVAPRLHILLNVK